MEQDDKSEDDDVVIVESTLTSNETKEVEVSSNGSGSGLYARSWSDDPDMTGKPKSSKIHSSTQIVKDKISDQDKERSKPKRSPSPNGHQERKTARSLGASKEAAPVTSLQLLSQPSQNATGTKPQAAKQQQHSAPSSSANRIRVDSTLVVSTSSATNPTPSSSSIVANKPTPGSAKPPEKLDTPKSTRPQVAIKTKATPKSGGHNSVTNATRKSGGHNSVTNATPKSGGHNSVANATPKSGSHNSV